MTGRKPDSWGERPRSPRARPDARNRRARRSWLQVSNIPCEHRGARRLASKLGEPGDTYEITPQDLQQALAKQGMKLEKGDAVIIYTGWGKLWGKDNARYVKTCPGIGIAAAEWLVKQDPMLIGADNWPVEVAPNPDKEISLSVHQILLPINGVHILENLKLDELVAKKVYEFAFIMRPLKMKGFSGASVAPTAIR